MKKKIELICTDCEVTAQVVIEGPKPDAERFEKRILKMGGCPRCYKPMKIACYVHGDGFNNWLVERIEDKLNVKPGYNLENEADKDKGEADDS